MEHRQLIDLFLHQKKLAIAGVSRNPKKFGFILFKTAREKGYSVTPVNPNGGLIDDVPFVSSVSALNGDIQYLVIATHKRDTAKVVEEAISKGIRNVWIQNGCETDEAIRLALENNINLVYRNCFLMYASPTGVHKFHQTLAKWFGKYVKETGETKITP